MEHSELGVRCGKQRLLFVGLQAEGGICDYCGGPEKDDDPLYAFECRDQGLSNGLILHRTCTKPVMLLGHRQWEADRGDYGQLLDNIGALHRASTIAYDEAQELIDGGDWISHNQLDMEVWGTVDRTLDVLLRNEAEARSALVDYKPKPEDIVVMPEGPMLPLRMGVLHAIRDHAIEISDTRQIDPDTVPGNPSYSHVTETYSRGGKVIKVGATFRRTTLPALSIFGSILAVGDWSRVVQVFGSGLRTLSSVRDVIKAIWESVEQLRGEELFVAEYIFLINTLNGRGAKLEEIELRTLGDTPIFADLPYEWSTLSVDDRKAALARVLGQLKDPKRNILKEEKGLWTFVF